MLASATANSFQAILATTAMKLIHAGHTMLNQELQKIEQISEEYAQVDESNPLLDEMSLLFQLDFQNPNALLQNIEKINAFLAKHVAVPKELLSLKKGVSDFKTYLQLASLFNKTLNGNAANESEFIAELENNLKPLLQEKLQEIEKNPLLKTSLQSLINCIQKLKLAKIEPRLSQEEPLTDRDKTRFKRWHEELKAFKFYAQAPKVMSGPWLKKVVDANKHKEGNFFNTDFTVNEAGIKRFESIIKSAFARQNEPLNQDDLALIGVLFDRKAVKKVLKRYGLKGDGCTDYPFTNQNLNALLLGLAANLNNEEMRRLHPVAHQVVLQVKTSFKTSNELASPDVVDALQSEFAHEKQNKTPHSASNILKRALYNKSHTVVSKLTRYIGNILIASINVLDSEWFKNNSLKLLDIFKPENLPLYHLTQDIDLLRANAAIDQYIVDMPNPEQADKQIKVLLKDLKNNTVRKFCLLHKEYQFSQSDIVAFKVYKDALNKETPEVIEALLAKVKSNLLSKMNQWDNVVDEIMSDLKNLSFDRFIKKYPAFKEGNCSSEEFLHLQTASANAKSNMMEQAKWQAARSCVYNKLQAIYPYARAAMFSHVLAYNSEFYSPSKSGMNFRLPLQNGMGANFAAKPIIHDEQGLAVTLFSPCEEIEGETIPLVFMCEGSHDFFSALRDLQPFGAGMEEFFTQKPYLNRVFSALNEEIESLAKKYPAKKVSIEIFGHSLAGADVYQLALSIQEAMAQNKARTAAGNQDYLDLMDPKNRDGFLQAKNPELRGTLPQALKESLGLAQRDFGHGYVDDRKFSQQAIRALNVDRIAQIKAYPKNGAGVHHKILSSIAATAAFLGKNADYTLYDNPLDLSGDAVQRTAHGRGLFMADPFEVFFKDKIKLAHCKFQTQKEGLLNQAQLLAQGRLAPLEVHQDKVFDQGPASWLQKDAKITRNNSAKAMNLLRNELANPITIDGKRALVDIRAYTKVKSLLHFMLTLITSLLLPIIELSRKWLSHLDNKVADTIGVVSPKQESENSALKKTRGAVTAKERDLLLTPMHQSKKLPPFLPCKPMPTCQKQPSSKPRASKFGI